LPQTAADYRAHAEECERLAAAAISPENRAMMIILAHRWRALAAEDFVRTILIEEVTWLTRRQNQGTPG